MKRSELFFSFLLVPVDWLMIMAAASAAYFLRYQTALAEVRPIVFNITWPEYLRIAAGVALIWLVIFAWAQLYTIGRTISLGREFIRIILACTIGLSAITLAIFLRHELFGSRFLVLIGYALAIVFVWLGRVAVRGLQHGLFKRGISLWRVVLFGDDSTARALEQIIKGNPASGLRIVRHFRKLDETSLGMLANIAKDQAADMVIHADNNDTRQAIGQLWEFCQINHLDFSYATATFEARSGNVEFSELGGIPLVQIKRTALDGWGRIAKRIFDIVFALTSMIFIIPLSLVVGLAIKLDSRGPIFVKLARVGEGGRKFTMYKFRSMIAGAEALKTQLQLFNERGGGPLFKMKNDPRVTRLGRLLRKSSLDELPNFISVLSGKMSLIGPRPHEPEEVGRYAAAARRLLTIKPGITGLAQISGRSDLDFTEEERLDLHYIEHWSFWLDLKILLKTIGVVLKSKNAV